MVRVHAKNGISKKNVVSLAFLRAPEGSVESESVAFPVVDRSQRFHDICQGMNSMLEHYSVHHPDAFRALLYSQNQYTDGHVMTMLDRYSRKNRSFEDDVWFALRYVWKTTIERNHVFRSYLAEKEPALSPLCHTETMLQTALRDGGSYQDFESVGQLKQHYLTWKWLGLQRPDGRMLCSVLFCDQTRHAQQGFSLNNMWYCDEHAGLAFFNGLRHSFSTGFCKACSIWNIVALKFTGQKGDRTHLDHMEKYFRVPLEDADSGPLNVRLQKFRDLRYVIPGWFGEDTSDAHIVDHLRLVGPKDGAMYEPAAASKHLRKGHKYDLRRVPPHSWAWLNDHNIAKAWIRVVTYNPQTDVWHPEVIKVGLLRVLKRLRQEKRSPVMDWNRWM